MSAVDELLANNEAYAAAFDSGSLPPAPARRMAIVTCMDARVDIYRALGLRPGDAHVIRNAGGIVTDDVLRSLLLSQQLLGTEEIVVVQHTLCGLLGLRDDELAAQIEAETGERPPFALGGFEDLDASVRASIARLEGSALLQRRDRVRGFVLDVETGRLREAG
jgi:carbonic anhydrase